MSRTRGVGTYMEGIGPVWVTGVDLARGIPILVVPGSVFQKTGHASVDSFPKGAVILNWGSKVALSLINL